MPKVSIIMPVYNGERFLKKSIESVLGQTFTDWELWFVDDCSSDSSPQIMDEYAAMDSRIHVIHNLQNQKLPRALNIGFEYASGEYWTWTSDDNIYESQAIENMVEYLDTHQNIGLVYTDMYFIDESEKILSEFKAPVDETCLLDDILGGCFMYRAECARTVGEYADDLFLGEDYDYCLRLRQVTQAARIPKFLYLYRYHSASLTLARHAECIRALNKVQLKHLDYILQNIDEQNRKRFYCHTYCIDPSIAQNLKQKFFADNQLPKELLWLERNRLLDRNKKAILFGCGGYGYKALQFLGEENVFCYVDNNSELWGKEKHGKKIISVAQLKEIYSDYQIILSVDSMAAITLANQLEDAGIYEFVAYLELLNRSAGKKEL